MMPLAKFLTGLAALYLVIILLIALTQTRLLFPTWAAAGGAVLLTSAAPLEFKLDGGEALVGVHVPAVRPRPPDASLILGFGGNAWNAEALASTLHALFPDRDVVAFHYRGYGPSSGRPSAKALLADARSIHDHVAARLGAERIVAVGFSIGVGPAAHLASRRPIVGTILVTPFDSLKALARAHYPWAPVGLLLRHHMEVAEAVAASAAPVALIAAERDTIVPPRRTEPLRQAARNLVLDRTIAGAGHNDLYGRPEFAAAMREALARIEAHGDEA